MHDGFVHLRRNFYIMKRQERSGRAGTRSGTGKSSGKPQKYISKRSIAIETGQKSVMKILLMEKQAMIKEEEETSKQKNLQSILLK